MLEVFQININDSTNTLCFVQVTDAVVEVVDQILNRNVSVKGSDNFANASSIIVQSFEQQISQTLEEHGNFKAIQPNVVVEAITLNEAQARDGISFSVNHQMRSQNGTNSTSVDDDDEGGSSNQTSSISLPNTVLFNSKAANGK